MRKISVVTVNYNNLSETNKCISSLKKLKIPNIILDIIVVDNASREKFVLGKNISGVTILTLKENLGFTGGNNFGIKYALSHNTQYIMLLNNDTVVDQNLLLHLLSVLEKDDKIGIVSPKIYFAKGHEFHKERYKNEELGRVIWYAGGGIDWGNVISFHFGVDEVDNGQYNELKEIDFATGCCMLFQKDILRKVGFFDEKYFLYYEDADICVRSKKMGYKIVYVPESFLWHSNAASSGTGSNLHDYYLARNKLIFGLKYASLRAKIALFREAIMLLIFGRIWQRRGIIDYFSKKLGKGSYHSG